MANNTDLKKFAQSARRQLREQVAARLEQVLKTDSAALREREAARKELSQQIAETSKKAVIDRVAYTWFNRFCALRFMDANHYNRIGVVSPAEGFTQPEILQEAKQGYIDSDLQAFVDCQAVFDLLGGRRPSVDPQQEAYRLLLVGTCNALNKVMPFLFEPIADYTELLMPQDLLSDHSILHDLREVMTAEACQDVEVIGWLYQFYISERKDEVFEALKQNQKIAPEDIPAATQLFTPHWIVRYLVENSLGRLWMLNRPSSRLAEKMDYFIKPEEPETDFLRVASPEEIKVCDPACGSGHMLTYAFDLLYAIYEEEGYPASDIPRMILEKNLHGIEIDERAGDLAAFALVMKARGKDRRFFTRDIQPKICVLENISFTDQELKEYAITVGRGLFSDPLLQTLKQFENAKNIGSLICPTLSAVADYKQALEQKSLSGNIFLYDIHSRVIRVLNQAEYLSKQFEVVVTNPPYMGSKGMNDEVKDFLNINYSNGKSDLFSAFILRILRFALRKAEIGLITPYVWMFISSYEELRKHLLDHITITNLVQLEYNAFEPAVIPVCAYTIQNSNSPEYPGNYIRLSNFRGVENQAPKTIEAIKDAHCGWFFKATSSMFRKFPGLPIAYWLSSGFVRAFEHGTLLEKLSNATEGVKTGDNEKFIRLWFEVPYLQFAYNVLPDKIIDGSKTKKWFAYHKGGEYRRWYGNLDYAINWKDNGSDIKQSPGSGLQGKKFYFHRGITWTKLSSHKFGVRLLPYGVLFDSGSPALFPNNPGDLNAILCFLESKVATAILNSTNPTLNFQVGNITNLPFIQEFDPPTINNICQECISITKEDWNSFETSWEFQSSPLLSMRRTPKFESIATTYDCLASYWESKTLEMKHLEEKNNAIFLSAYGLNNEISSEVSLKDVTLTSNAHYRYPGNSARIYSSDELEIMLLADTMREFISYAVGCMFGRYSLDKPGLILANQGETLQDYLRKIPDPTFMPDEDNAIPVLDGEWFSDDIAERFKKFLRITFGTEHYEENLAFIEQAIGRDIRSYFLKEFYSQHVRMYQKRPIYWMFSSSRGSFNVLIYMHRYQPDTLSVILNRYLREFRGKLEGRKAHLEQVSISASSTQREKTAALKEIEGLNKTLEEIRVYERDVLYPLAVQGIKIDLDDGVKVNYNKFGKALAKITGLSE